MIYALFSIAILISLVVPWISLARTSRLQKEVEALKNQLNALLDIHDQASNTALQAMQAAPPPKVAEQLPEPTAEPTAKPAATPFSEPQAEVAPDIAEPKPAQSIPAEPKAEPEAGTLADWAGLAARDADIGADSVADQATYTIGAARSSKEGDADAIGFERQFAAKLPVWIGGVALALAGFFLVRYSIEIGLLGPAVRVVLSLLFGLLLLYAGHWVRVRPDFANGTRIAQALSGAGIAVLYGSVYAASRLYGFVSSGVGFAGFAFITAAGIVLSLKQGMPVALLGLVGGLLAPALLP
jgi:uncharacterized membrane protein